jgi:hypothetical protein
MNVAAIAWALFSGYSASYGDETPSGRPADKQYYVDATLFSMESEKGLESFRDYGSGGVGPIGSLGLGVSSDGRDFKVTVKGATKSGHFMAKLNVTPTQADRRTAAMEQIIDLSDLKPQQLDLARDDDNRVYRLNLFPRILEHPTAKTFRAADLSLEEWHFNDSPVILNDQDYLGTLNMGHAPIAWIDIPGLAKVEFSLLPLTGSKPEGVLEEGSVNITHNSDTRLRISNVRNGFPSATLVGGPYRVWVRWAEPTETIEEYRQALKGQLETIKQQAKDGDIDLPQGVDRLERSLNSDRLLLISSGIRSAGNGDIDSQQQ